MTAEIPSSGAPSFLKRVLLRLMLVLIGVGVAVAIVAELRGEPLGEALSKVVATTIGTSIFASLAVGCADAAERRASFVAFAGVAFACTAVAVFFVGVWFELMGQDWWWRAMIISSCYALALWRAARLVLVRLQRPSNQLVVTATAFACVGIASAITLMILHDVADPSLMRIMNALWIAAIGGHVAIPILVRLEGKDGGTARASNTDPPAPSSPPSPPPPPSPAGG